MEQSDRHSFRVSNTTFDIPKRYELIRSVGTGAYGVVISALDTSANVKVAIKKIPRAFSDLVDAKRILREITLLRQFDHENVVSIVNILPPIDEDWTDLYVVSELMETDLHRIIYSKQDLSIDHVQYFVYQVLRALKYMHSANVLHRDLKPSNLLLNSNCDLKVCDLGLARGVDPDHRPGELTEYVVTRWYRAPEIMLACQEYSKAIDVWSTGCVFAELLERKAVFPGDDYIDQIRRICRKLGRPTVEDLDFVTSEKAKTFILQMADTPAKTIPKPAAETKPASAAATTPGVLRSHFPPETDADALDLLETMLVFNPRKRCSVERALEHKFMHSLHVEADEPEAGFQCSFDFEKDDLDREKLKALVWSEMLHYNPRLRPGASARLLESARDHHLLGGGGDGRHHLVREDDDDDDDDLGEDDDDDDDLVREDDDLLGEDDDLVREDNEEELSEESDDRAVGAVDANTTRTTKRVAPRAAAERSSARPRTRTAGQKRPSSRGGEKRTTASKGRKVANSSSSEKTSSEKPPSKKKAQTAAEKAEKAAAKAAKASSAKKKKEPKKARPSPAEQQQQQQQGQPPLPAEEQLAMQRQQLELQHQHQQQLLAAAAAGIPPQVLAQLHPSQLAALQQQIQLQQQLVVAQMAQQQQLAQQQIAAAAAAQQQPPPPPGDDDDSAQQQQQQHIASEGDQPAAIFQSAQAQQQIQAQAHEVERRLIGMPPAEFAAAQQRMAIEATQLGIPLQAHPFFGQMVNAQQARHQADLLNGGTFGVQPVHQQHATTVRHPTDDGPGDADHTTNDTDHHTAAKDTTLETPADDTKHHDDDDGL